MPATDFYSVTGTWQLSTWHLMIRFFSILAFQDDLDVSLTRLTPRVNLPAGAAVNLHQLSFDSGSLTARTENFNSHSFTSRLNCLTLPTPKAGGFLLRRPLPADAGLT